jgi:hypothetical protein
VNQGSRLGLEGGEMDIDHFMQFVRKEKNCWIWIGRTEVNGLYGRIRAHHASYLHFKGRITGNVLHCCGEKTCVNPDHLFLQRTMTKEERIEIRSRYPRETVKSLAFAYRTSVGRICSIICRIR